MTDIVTRLRLCDEQMVALDHLNRPYGLAKSLEHEAADEIERLRMDRDVWRNESIKKQAACEQMGARITGLEAELSEAVERGNDWCDQAKKARAECDQLRAAILDTKKHDAGLVPMRLRLLALKENDQ